jgi:hypothetical protein
MCTRRAILICCMVLLFPDPARPDEDSSPKKILKEYNRVLHDGFSDPASGDVRFDPGTIEGLIDRISGLLCRPDPDCRVLQGLDFLYSYQVIDRLEKTAPPGSKDCVDRWKQSLVRLDIQAHNTNRYFLRPSALWVVGKSKRISAQPTRRMLGGYIEREENTVYISGSGEECQASKRGCDRLRYVLIRCLVPGIHEPEEARAVLHAFPADLANPRLVNYMEVPLSEKNRLIRRNYFLRPFPGYKGVMENYYEIVFEDSQRLIILEQNTREGKFILRTDNGGVFIKSPPYGITVALLFSGKYVMEKVFYALLGNKLLEEPAQALSILRQYMMHPDDAPEEAVRRGREDFEKKERLK